MTSRAGRPGRDQRGYRREDLLGRERTGWLVEFDEGRRQVEARRIERRAAGEHPAARAGHRRERGCPRPVIDDWTDERLAVGVRTAPAARS